jgi:ubiquinone biosynthesis protein
LSANLLSFAYWRRYAQIRKILKRHGLNLGTPWTWLSPFKQADLPGRNQLGFSPPQSPQHLRMALEELGPTFIKIGQLLSVRTELLPASFISELKKLQSEVPPFPFAMVQEIFKQNGWEIEQIFSRLDPLPLAAASVAQVHYGVLQDGREVAVKVQRVGIQSLMRTDLSILRDLSIMLEKRTPWAKAYSLRLIVEEMSTALYRELDFVREAKNMEAFRRNFQDNPRIIIPQVIAEYSAPQILTMEYVPGLSIADHAELDRRGISRSRIITDLAEILYQQVYVHGFFHADPHPGNLALGPDQAIIFYDFGQVGDIDQLVKENFVDLLVSMVRYDVNGVTRAILNIGEDTSKVSPRILRRDVARLQKKYYGVPLSQIDLPTALRELLDLFTHYHIRVPAELSLLAKMLITAESLFVQLNPEISIVDLVEPYGKRVVLQRFKLDNLLTDLENLAIDYTHSLKELPRELDALLHTLNEGEIGVSLDPTPWEPWGERWAALARRRNLSLILCSLILAGAGLAARSGATRLFGVIPLLEGTFVLGLAVAVVLINSARRDKRTSKKAK